MVIWNPKFVSGSASNRFMMAGFVGSASSAAGGRLCGAGGKTALTGCAAGSLSGASSSSCSSSTSVSAAAIGCASGSSALRSSDASSSCGTSARCDSSSSPAACFCSKRFCRFRHFAFETFQFFDDLLDMRRDRFVVIDEKGQAVRLHYVCRHNGGLLLIGEVKIGPIGASADRPAVDT